MEMQVVTKQDKIFYNTFLAKIKFTFTSFFIVRRSKAKNDIKGPITPSPPPDPPNKWG